MVPTHGRITAAPAVIAPQKGRHKLINRTWWRGLALVAIFALGWAGITVFLWEPESRAIMVFLVALASAHLTTTAWIINANKVPEPEPAQASEGEILLHATAHRHLHVTD